MPNLNWRRFWERAKYWDLTNVLSDKTFVKIEYRNRMRKKLNLKTPQTFNEKLQWLKIYDRKPIYTTMVDKYEVKNYVADKIGDEYIIPTLGVWDLHPCCCLIIKLCPTLCDPVDCSPLGSSLCPWDFPGKSGLPFPFPGDLSDRIESIISRIGRWILYH